MPERQGREPEREVIAQLAEHLGHGLTWVASTVLFLFLGWLADGWLGTTPLLTILGAFVGAGAGFYNLYRRLVLEPRRRERAEKDESAGGRQP